ncbi:MAG: universal stress protein [Calothrix sp. SM1_5_4]|nr:universal stress protein [Calothrix sp. SM1_5_4]
MANSECSRIVWAVDALEDPKQHKNALFILGALSRGTGAKIQPVYVLSAADARMPKESVSQFSEAFQALAEKRLAELRKNSDIPEMLPGKVIFNSKGGLRADFETLVQFAKGDRADMIVVATHARRGLQRVLMGSFAETLVLRSSVPVITVNPEAAIREKSLEYTFPDDVPCRVSSGVQCGGRHGPVSGCPFDAFVQRAICGWNVHVTRDL